MNSSNTMMLTNDSMLNQTCIWNTTSLRCLDNDSVTTDQDLGHCGENSPSCSLYLFVVYAVLLGPVAAAGIAANLLTFIVFWKDAMKTSTSFLLQSLAVVDIVLLITAFLIHALPQLIDYTGWSARWYTDYGYALVLVYILPIAFVAQTATVWVTILVAVNRYIAVCRPYQAARLCTVSQARWHLCVVVAVCFVYNIPRFIEGRLEVIREYDNDSDTILAFKGHYVIDEIYEYPRIYFIIYQNVFYTMFLLLLPFLALSWLNVRLISALSALKAKRALMQSSRHQQQDSGVTLVLVVVIIVFLLCQTPAFLNQIFWNVLQSTSRCCGGFQFYFRCICNLLVAVNSAANFIIYVEFNKRFRRVFVQLITCQAGVGGFGNITVSGTGIAMEVQSYATNIPINALSPDNARRRSTNVTLSNNATESSVNNNSMGARKTKLTFLKSSASSANGAETLLLCPK